MRRIQPTFGLLLSLLCVSEAYSQCSALRQQRNISFNTDKDCAPVTVTDFTITYFFNVPQDPGDIRIRFEWNDPGNNADEYGVGDSVFIVGVGNTEFTATGTFTYPDDENCVFNPTSYIIAVGDLCETSEQEQLVTSWADDNSFGGVMSINPANYDVCYNNAVVDAVFSDNSTFNCNITQNPDAPNRQPRHTQFVYGTNHNAASSIRNLSLVDGSGTVVLTDGGANLASTTTINGVTAAYFGPIDNIPFPADGPVSVSFPMSAPADANNLVGNVFEVTLFNWNTCNPYNGNPASPNYADAVQTQAYIRIVDPPVPDFQTRKNDVLGAIQTVFCLGETVYFENLTTGATNYTWEFFDDDTGTSLITTSTSTNPTLVYSNPGDKLVRLTVDNNAASGDCEDVVEKIITLSPTSVADIGFYDPTLTTPITPVFCSVSGIQTITVGFKDQTINAEPMTEWRWEFYDENGVLNESIPAGAGTYGPSVTDFTRDYTTQGEYAVRLIARNTVSGCESIDEDTITIYDAPEVLFDFTEVCEGERTLFFDIADSISSLNPRVNDDWVATYDWDFSFDGNSFNPEATYTHNNDFAFFLDGDNVTSAEPGSSVAGTYNVALRMTTTVGGCSNILSQQVTVHPLPVPLLASDYTQPICPGDSVQFANNSNLTSADFLLIVTDSIAWLDTLDFNQAGLFYAFQNSTDSVKHYYVTLYGQNTQGCEAVSNAVEVEVLPSSISDFDDPDYSPFAANCSIWESTLVVDPATQNLNPDQYTWTISDADGILPGYPVTKTGGSPDFHQLDYQLENNTASNRVYVVTLDVSKSDRCISSSQKSFLINPKPDGMFLVTETDSCEDKTIMLEANQPGLSDYIWDFDPAPDQYFDNNQQQTLVYNRPAPGSPDLQVSVSLVTENLAGCASDTVTTDLTVGASQPPLVAFFEVDRETIRQPDSVINFTNGSSSYSGVSWLWDFGDGTTSADFAPGNHSYTAPGMYEVVLDVDNEFCTQEFSLTVEVEPADPIIDFAGDVLEGCSPLTVQFTNTSRYAVSGTFIWDFGDGKSSTQDEPVHTYARGGVYMVTLYGENSIGSGAQEIKQDYITVTESPIASFEISPVTVMIPDQQVYFKNRSVNATSYQWDFGDGQSSTEEEPVHGYEEEGTYDITLITFNALGCSDTLRIPAGVQAVAGGSVKVPNAFSPSLAGPGSTGGDTGGAINDVFLPRVDGVILFRMLIFNKWGQLLFESNSQETGWDGYYKGQLQPSDVYVYKLELTFSDGREGIRVGDVTLVR